MKIIDAHIHVDRFKEQPGKDFDFFNPPEIEIIDKLILNLMNENNVEKAVIMQHPNIPLNSEIIQILRKYPEKFKGAMILDLNSKNIIDDIENNFNMGLNIIKLEMFGTTMLHPNLKLNSELMKQIYKKAEELGMVIVIDPFRIGLNGYQPDALREIIPLFPNLKFVICHLGFPFQNSHLEDNNKVLYEKMLSLASNDNVWFDITAMPDMFEGIEEYPYNSALQLISEFIKVYGENKLIFGSDIPGELSQQPYDKLISMFLDTNLLNEKEKKKILYLNANLVYFNKDEDEEI